MSISTQGHPEVGSDSANRNEDRTRDFVSAAVGILLIVIGGLLLTEPVIGLEIWGLAWPFFVILPGVLLLIGMIIGGKSASVLAIPGTIVTTTGLVLMFQNTFNAWHTWAYAWALIAPTSIGLGLWLHGVWSGEPEPRRVGLRLIEIGLFMFAGFGVFFEVLLNLSGVMHGTVATAVTALVLIGLGVYLLLRTGQHGSHGSVE